MDRPLTDAEQMLADYRAGQRNAQQNGLVMAGVSAKRYVIVRFGGVVSDRPPKCWFSGQVAHGPASYESCLAWIEEYFAKATEGGTQ